MPHEHDPAFYRLVPAWVINELRDRLARIERNQETIMDNTDALTAATDALTAAIVDLEARVAAGGASVQPAIDAATQAITDATTRINAVDPAA